MKIYEVEVTVEGAMPPKNVCTPSRLIFVVKASSEVEAMTEALNRARQSQAKRPRVFKNATFVCKRPCIREAFTKDKLH